MAATAWPDWESLGTLFPTPADFTVSYTARAQERGQHQMEATVESSPFGTLPDGTKIEMFTLTNAHGAIAKVITYGATLTELWMPDRAGKMGDVVLGFDNLQGYLGSTHGSVPPSGELQIGLRKANSLLTAKNIRLRSTIRPTTFIAAHTI